MRRYVIPCAALLLLALQSAAAPPDKRPMKVEDLFAFKRVAAPQISPDGKRVVYQVTTVDLEKNKSSTALWIAATDGKTPPKQLTDPKGKRDAEPRPPKLGKKEQQLVDAHQAGQDSEWGQLLN